MRGARREKIKLTPPALIGDEWLYSLDPLKPHWSNALEIVRYRQIFGDSIPQSIHIAGMIFIADANRPYRQIVHCRFLRMVSSRVGFPITS